MRNKQALMHLVDRAERGVLLPEEGKILRDAIELLDDMAMTLDMLASGGARYSALHGYEASTTQSFRAIQPYDSRPVADRPQPAPKRIIIDDDDSPGRP